VSEPRVRKRNKVSARERMHAKRAKAPEINPCPTGAVGGQYKPLTDTDIKKIYQCALDILSEIGMGEAPPALVQQALSKGAVLNEAGRLCFPKSMVESIIDGACKSFILPGRESTLQDLHDFTRLADSLNNVSWFTRCCVATDLADLFELDVNTAFALLKGTTKPVGTSFTVASSVDPIIDMFDTALGGEGEFCGAIRCNLTGNDCWHAGFHPR